MTERNETKKVTQNLIILNDHEPLLFLIKLKASHSI